MYQISKEFHFSASHQLSDLPSSHPCARLHGHNYRVVIELASDSLNPFGFVQDYNDLNRLKEFIDHTLDHRHLNDVLGHNQTTAENLARYIYDWSIQHWPEVSAIRISETPKTWAEYRP